MVRIDCHTFLFPPLTSAKKPCFYQKLSPKVLYFSTLSKILKIFHSKAPNRLEFEKKVPKCPLFLWLLSLQDPLFFALHAHVWEECCSLVHGLQKLENFVFLKQNRAIWWILLGANLIKVMKTKFQFYRLNRPNCILWMDRPSSLALVKYGRGYILKPPSVWLCATWLSKQNNAKCSWGCASGGILSVRCNAGPTEGPGKIVKYKFNLRLYPVNFSNKLCILRFIILSIWPNFFDPPFYYGKRFGPPLSVTQNFFGPPPFCPAPPPKYLWTLPKELL